MLRLKNSIYWGIVVFVSLASASCSDKDVEVMMALSESCIWSEAPHCAFTDLIEYKNKIYCCFREGLAHVPTKKSEFGKIRIIVTEDGEIWKSIGIISDSDYDLRDPKFSIAPDGRLMLNYGRYNPDDNDHVFTAVKFISDEELENRVINSRDFHPISIESNKDLSKYWIWKIRWINGIAYGVAYRNGYHPILVKSSDGINFSIKTELEIMGNEADLTLLPDEKMLIIIRGQDDNGFIGVSTDNNYKEWNWNLVDDFIHCPNILNIGIASIIAGRGFGGTYIYYLNDKRLDPLVKIDGNIDYAYPGMIYRNNELWITYYNTSQTGEAKVFLRKYPCKYLLSQILL